MKSQSEVIPVMPTPLHLLLFCCVYLGSPGLGQVVPMGQWFLWVYVLSIHVTVPVLTVSLFHLLLRVLSNFYFVTHGIYFLTAVRTETSTANALLSSITTSQSLQIITN